MSAPPQPGSKLSYNPEPFERAYYSGLFAAADIERTGKIGGAQAVQFFSRSKLPVDALKNIWIVADQPATNYLDHAKFAVAIRLIQCIQNGQKGAGPNLLSPPGVVMRPVMFEGVSGVSVPLPTGGPGPAQGQPGQSPQRSPQLAPQQPPQQQQQQQQAPPSPGGSISTMNGGGPPSRALAVQDPYALSASDRARYEQMFPNYARDGYVMGAEAVALFSKSGMPQEQLAAIWNMVDSPVDNRLDKLEFAMAMHLIVCVSKRNLPLPPSLPGSLQQLKSQQQQQPPPPQRQPGPAPPGQTVPLQRTPTYDSNYGGGGQSVASGSVIQQQPVPSPSQQPRAVMQPQPGMPSPPMQSVGGGGPPPPLSLQQQQAPPSPGGMLQPGQGIPSPQAMSQGGGFGQMPQQQGQQPPVQYGGFPQQQQEMPPPAQARSYSPAMSAQTAPAIQSGGMMPPPAAGGDMHNVSNISDAFAGLSAGGVDEASYASVPPVTTSSSFEMNPPSHVQQQQQQSQQLGGGIPEPGSVASMPEPTSFSMGPSSGASAAGGIPEPAAPAPAVETVQSVPRHNGSSSGQHHATSTEDTENLKSTLQKLKAENISLKAQLGSMSEGEKEAQEELHKTVSEIAQLTNELTTLRAQVLAAKSRLLETTAELKANREKKSVMTDLIKEAEATKIAIDEATAGVESTIAVAQKPPTPPPAAVEQDLFGFGPAPGQPTLSQVPAPSAQEPAPAPQPLPTPGPVEPSVSFDQSIDMPAPSAGTASGAETPSQQETSTPDEDSTAYGYNFVQASRPAAIQDNDRAQSTNSAFGTIMGAGTLPSLGPSFAFSGADSTDKGPGNESFASVPSVKEIDDMKKKAKDAEDVAREAEESSRQVMAQVAELRRVADEADAQARKHAAEHDDSKKKKKGFLGRGGAKKKHDAKEAERLAKEAKEKKDKLLQAQSQANDAQALAMDTKREAEKLRNAAEEAEVQAASAASTMQHQEEEQRKQQQEDQQNQTAAPTNGFGHHGQSFPMTKDMGMPPPLHGQQQFGGGGGVESGPFNSNVMANGGGIEIPTPSGDPYDNPFGV